MDKLFARFANGTAKLAGHPLTFLICGALVVIWGISGPFFGYSENWQLVINTSTTIVTFLMVFLIQNTQNRDSSAVQAKLDELIRSSDAENRFMGIEKLTDRELVNFTASASKQPCKPRLLSNERARRKKDGRVRKV